MPEWFFPPLFSYDFDAADSPFLLLYPQRLPSEPHMDGGLFVDIYTLHGIWLPCPPGPAMPPSEKWLQLDYLLQKELSRWESGRYVQDPNAEERLRIQKWVPVPGPPSTATVSPTPPNLQVAEALLEWERLLSAIESKLPSSAPSERQREEPLRLEAMEGLYLSKFAKDFLGLSPRPKGWTFVAPGIRTVSEAGLREIYSVEAEDSFRRTVTAWEKGEDWVTLLLPSVKTVPVDVSHVSDRDISSFNDPYGFGMATVGRRAGLYTASADERDGDLVQLLTGGYDPVSGPPTAGTPDSTDIGGPGLGPDDNEPSNKRRKTARGSRGVANLTPEQLERKRANDREAQRAIRERQRLRTEQYEQEIAELKSKQPYQELQGVLRQKEAVEAELAEVKRCLAAIMAMIQPIVGGRGEQPSPSAISTPTTNDAQSRVYTNERPFTSVWSLDGGQPSQPPPEMEMLQQQRYDLAHGLDLGSDRLGLEFLVDPSLKIARIQGGLSGAQDSPQYRHVPMKHDWTAATSMIPGMPVPKLPPPARSTPSSSTSSPNATSAPPKAARDHRPALPLRLLLLNPTASLYSHPLSKVFTDILARFPDLHTLPERVAVLYMMFLFMRWQVSPTEENYLRLPSWFRPVRGQVDRPHPAWYDHIPFPRMREELVKRYEEPGAFPFENFFIPFTTTLSVNWPYEDAYVLLASPTGEELMINPVFEQHLGVEANWTLGEAFERAFPALVGTYNLRRERREG
ncbi:hypothetical protein N0V88_000501 [Collariella sp. IMI 366227]|nr:hypothetical protein N0V88_000501 [Collariella sp. IMI 366227]